MLTSGIAYTVESRYLCQAKSLYEEVEYTYATQYVLQKREDGRASVVILIRHEPKHDWQNLIQQLFRSGTNIVCE